MLLDPPSPFYPDPPTHRQGCGAGARAHLSANIDETLPSDNVRMTHDKEGVTPKNVLSEGMLFTISSYKKSRNRDTPITCDTTCGCPQPPPPPFFHYLAEPLIIRNLQLSRAAHSRQVRALYCTFNSRSCARWDRIRILEATIFPDCEKSNSTPV